MNEQKVKQILEQNTHTGMESFGDSGDIEFSEFDIETATKQICDLFMPDESLLLSDEEIRKIESSWYGGITEEQIDNGDCPNILTDIANAQLAKDQLREQARVKDAYQKGLEEGRRCQQEI